MFARFVDLLENVHQNKRDQCSMFNILQKYIPGLRGVY